MTGSKESQEGLVTIRDFIRWGASQFSHAGLFFGHGSDNALDESLHLVFQVLQLPWDLPESYLDCRLSAVEREKIALLIADRTSSRKPLAYLLNQAWFCCRFMWTNVCWCLAHPSLSLLPSSFSRGSVR